MSTFRIAPVSATEAFAIAPHATLGAVALHLIHGNGSQIGFGSSDAGVEAGAWRVQGLRILPSITSDPVTQATEIVYQGLSSQQLAINVGGIFAGQYHGFGSNANYAQTAPNFTVAARPSSIAVNSSGNITWPNSLSGSWQDSFELLSNGTIETTAQVNLPADPFEAYLDTTFFGSNFIDASLDGGATWIDLAAVAAGVHTPANVASIIMRDPVTLLTGTVTDDALNGVAGRNKTILKRAGDYRIGSNLNPLPAGTLLNNVSVARSIVLGRAAPQTVNGFRTNYPAWNATVLSYIHPTSTKAEGRADFWAREEVNVATRWPGIHRVIGEAPAGYTSGGVTPGGAEITNGVWWFHQIRNTLSGGARAINTVGKLPVKFAAHRMPLDEDGWDRLIEVFLVNGAGTRVAEIGFLPYGASAFHNSGTALGNFTDRFGRQWSVRDHGVYRTAKPTAGDFLTGDVDFNDFFRFLVKVGELSGNERIEGGYVYYDVEAIAPGGKVDVMNTALSFDGFVEAKPIWSGAIDGNAGYTSTGWNPSMRTWDNAAKQLVFTRAANVTGGNHRTLFPITGLTPGQTYKLEVHGQVIGSSPSAGVTLGISTDGVNGGSQASSVNMTAALAAGTTLYQFTAQAATMYLVLNQGALAGSDNVFKLNSLGWITAA